MTRMISIQASGNPEMLSVLRHTTPGVIGGGVRQVDDSRADLASTIMEWLGKDPVRSRSAYPHPDVLAGWVGSWLHGNDVHTVVVTDAQLLSTAKLDDLTVLLSDVETLLLVRGPAASNKREWRGLPVEEGSWSHWKVRLSAAPPHGSEQPPSRLTAADLPLCHFLLFRTRVSSLLAPAHAERVDKLYAEAFKAARKAPTTTRQMVDHVEDVIVRHATCAADALVIVSATQAAMFERGWLMRVDPDVLWREFSDLKPEPADEDWRRVSWEHDPQIAAILTMFLLDVPETSITGFTVGQVRNVLATGRLARVETPPQAMVNLRARLHDLRDEPDEAPFITRRQLRAVRKHAQQNLGLFLHRPQSQSQGPLTGPISRLGIDLVQIGGRRG